MCDYYRDADIKVLVGCAPCQPFSKYTKRYRKQGERDEKWALLYSFGDLISDIQPDIVAMENVPELINEAVFHDFSNLLHYYGYHVYSNVVNCPDYGVPQYRKRVVLLASKFGEISLVPPLYSESNYRTVRDAISHLPSLQDGETDRSDAMHKSSKLSEINKKRISQSKPGGTWKDWDEDLLLSCHKKESGKSYPSVYGRMRWDFPSPTITTQFYGLGNGRFGHPEQDRALSLREGAILQSFPEDYVFVDSTHEINKRQLGIQIGNAVPVELGRAIGLSILNHLKGEQHGEENYKIENN